MIMAVANHGFSGRVDVGVGAHRGSRPSNDDLCLKVFDLEANVTIKECNGDVENSDDDEIDVSPRFGPNGKFMHYEERAANHEVQDLSPSASIPLDENHTNRSQKRFRKWVLMFALVLLVCIIFAVYLAGGNHKQKQNTLTMSQESITADDVIASPASNAPLQNANIDSEARPIKKKHTHVKKEHPNNKSKKPHKQHTHEKKDHPNRPGKSTSTDIIYIEVAPETLLDQSEVKYEDPLEEQSLFVEEEDIGSEEVLQEDLNDDSSESIAHHGQSVHNIFASDSD